MLFLVNCGIFILLSEFKTKDLRGHARKKLYIAKEIGLTTKGAPGFSTVMAQN